MNYYAPLISVLVTLLLTSFLLASRVARKINDVPNERSLHSEPVPRVGGLALIAGVLSGWAIMFDSLTWWIVLPILALLVVSLLDDMRGLAVRIRLLAHIGAALLVVLGSGLMARNLAVGVALLFFIVWMTNLYNFMDGSDGLAGGMTFFGFAAYGSAALVGNNEPAAMLNFAVAAAAAGFLYFNFHPAKVFMGDAGSIPLGFLAAAMGVWGWQSQLWPVWFPLLVFSPFVVDASATLLKRALRGEKVWQAHREHYYQRLLMLGAGHRNTALIEYGVMAGAGLSALWALLHPAATAYVLLIWCAAYAAAMSLVDSRWRAHRNA